MTQNHMLGLGQTILSQVQSLVDLITKANLPQPTSFSRATPTTQQIYPTVIQNCRVQLLEALDELRAVVLGPTSYIFNTCILNPSWTATFSVLYNYRIAHHVPLDGRVSYADLSARCGLGESDTRRIVRSAISLRIFEEDDVTGEVQHNAASAVLAATPAHDALGFFTEEYTPGALKISDALRRFPNSEKAAESAVAIANQIVGDGDIFSSIAHNPARVERLANAHSFITKVPETSLQNFVHNVPWAASAGSCLSCPKVVVDIGGSNGDLCKALLRAYPDIEKAIVEDLPEVTAMNSMQRGATPLDDLDLAGRIEYRAYNFFQEQAVRNADVYIFRTVLHDWADAYVVRILRNQIPALRTGARILINDVCIATPSHKMNTIISQAQWYVLEDPRERDATRSATDLMVKMALNAKERTRAEWLDLLSAADSRFAIKSIVTPPQSIHSVIEVVWDGNQSRKQGKDGRSVE